MFECLPNEVSRGPLGIFRHSTGVEDQEIRRLTELDQLEPLQSEPLSEYRGFGLIQSAAKRM